MGLLSYKVYNRFNTQALQGAEVEPLQIEGRDYIAIKISEEGHSMQQSEECKKELNADKRKKGETQLLSVLRRIKGSKNRRAPNKKNTYSALLKKH
jgi:hypothetical protein